METVMPAKDETDRTWALMEKISICMLANWDGSELRSRPMAAHVRPDEDVIYFLTDAREHKDEDIRRFDNVCLAFSDTGDQKYVSLSGHAEVLNDRAKVKELWSTPAKAWWQSADDPNIRVLKVTPVDAQYWDGPGTVVSYMKMAAAAATGSRPELGENRKVAM
jgi:general stress protein 26